MGQTPIQWADHSINPFRARNLKTGKVGHFCAKVSAGCKNCYSSKLQSPHLVGLPFLVENLPKVELFLEQKALDEVNRRVKPTKYFWCDMTDMFWEEYPDEWIDRCIGVMAWTRRHTHLVLTKRSKRLMEYSQGLAALTRQQRGVRMARAKGFDVLDDTPGGMDWPLPNIWFMVSCEDQPTADERITHLLQTPAEVRGVSYEPALGPINFFTMPWTITQGNLHWIIVGGESGPGARAFDLGWARNTVKQCAVAGVACFVKQIGAKPYQGGSDEATRRTFYPISDKKGGLMSEWPADIQVRQFPESPR